MNFNLDLKGTWLFCFAHPDDELAVAALMRRACQAGVDVHVVWSHSRPYREQESRAVAAEIGLRQENLTFLDGEDGTICHQIEDLLPKYRALMAQVSPHHVFTGAFEQGHLDHDATHFLARQTAPCPVSEFPLYHAYYRWYQTLGRFSNPGPAESSALSEADVQFKKHIAKMYPSQKIWRVLFWYEVLHRVTFRPSHILETEYLRPASVVNWLAPNHPEELARKILKSEKWQRWIAAMEDLERRQPGLVSGSLSQPAPVEAGSVLSQ